jgi:hypothetical protein
MHSVIITVADIMAAGADLVPAYFWAVSRQALC